MNQKPVPQYFLATIIMDEADRVHEDKLGDWRGYALTEIRPEEYGELELLRVWSCWTFRLHAKDDLQTIITG